jgi:hypothetical protein
MNFEIYTTDGFGGAEYLADGFGTLEEVAEFADSHGCGRYIWSEEGRGRYLGEIVVAPGEKPIVTEF